MQKHGLNEHHLQQGGYQPCTETSEQRAGRNF
jgi:hypothetical protein